ncbi:PREDICTED: uncharacterized protein LOC106748949 isoform X2 [Dinoponera quadriceps]|nr:PREDICTED: uncharacterized protein LOC106748949 isoform X2 [Dinoponera quadriceps]
MLKAKSSNNAHNRVEQSIGTWPSISSINTGIVNTSCATPSQFANIESEVLASSNNLKSIFPKREAYNINKKKMIITSSVKQSNTKDNHIDQYIMPPPTVNRVHRALRSTLQNRVHTSSEYGKSVSTPLNSSIQSFPSDFSGKNSNITRYTTVNTYGDKEYLHSYITPSHNDISKLGRIFSKWKVILNDQCQLIIKGTLECGKVARSKPVVRRYSTTCVESIFKHKYYLRGNITDERNELPDYIHGKFYNGFPDDWQNVHQIWSTFVSQGCPVTFRWPTFITDSDDDLKSEMTDLTYTCEITNRHNTLMTSYETTENARQVMVQPESLSNRLPRKMEKCQNCTRSTQNLEEEPTFVKSCVSGFEKDTGLGTQANDASNEKSRQNAKTTVGQSFSPRKINRLKDFLQEDKLNIIINNLADRNCSPKYIDKIIEMFDCLDYIISYKSATECNSVAESSNTSMSEVIPLQQISVCNENNHTNKSKLEEWTGPKSHAYSADLGYGSIRNEFSQVGTNARNDVMPEHKDDSESETYAGVPKISIERVLQSREALRRLPKRKVRKRLIQPDQQAMNRHHNAIAEFTVRPATSMVNESCVSITEEEAEAQASPKMRHKAANDVLSQDAAFYRRKDSVHEGMQHNPHKQLLSFFNLQKMEPSSHGTRCADVDYTDYSDAWENVATNAQKESAEAGCQVDLRKDVVVNNESSSSFSETRKELAEPPKDETAVRSKPTIISSIPVHLNLKLTKADVHRSAEPHDSDVGVNEDKRRASIRPKKRTREKPAPETSVAVSKPAPVANESLPKTTTDSKNRATSSSASNMKHESDSTTKPTTSAAGQSRKKTHGVDTKMLTAWMPKVVHDFTSKNALGLTFQGKLLNEAGHFISRNFRTDIVLRRLSPTLIETVNHEFYQLLGPLNDNKHVLHKELVKQCRHGCPAKIEQFCMSWKSLQFSILDKVGKNFHDTSTDLLSVPVSSRGRKILPPLCYWTGERVTLKDNTPVYNSGSLQELSLMSNENQKKNIKKGSGAKEEVNLEGTSMKTGATKRKSLPETNEVSSTSKSLTVVLDKISLTESPKAQAANNMKRSRKSAVNEELRIVKQLTFSSTDSNCEEEQQVSPRKRSRNFRSKANGDAKIQSRYSMTLRKRQKTEVSSNRASPDDASKTKNDAACRSPGKKPNFGHNVVCTYFRNVPQEDLLSEDLTSI